MYDRQLKLWKTYIGMTGYYNVVKGVKYTAEWGYLVYDLQADHMSQDFYTENINQFNNDIREYSLKELLAIGR